MTKAEWLRCVDPEAMLNFLRSKGSERKLRLFACACCRRIWSSLKQKRSRNAVEICESYADNRTTSEKMHSAYLKAEDAFARVQWAAESDIETSPAKAAIRLGCGSNFSPYWAADWAAATVGVKAREKDYKLRQRASSGNGQVEPWEQYNPTYLAARTAEELVQVLLLHDIFGNPFRPSPPLPPTVLTWNDSTVRRIAEGIYDERRIPEGTLDSARLAILSDALLEAGCDNEELIAHCRSPGPHVRGCWAIDQILEKT
jgi:hypothetical protein